MKTAPQAVEQPPTSQYAPFIISTAIPHYNGHTCDKCSAICTPGDWCQCRVCGKFDEEGDPILRVILWFDLCEGCFLKHGKAHGHSFTRICKPDVYDDRW